MPTPTERKVALITAGGNGIGVAAARILADDDFRFAILSSSGKGQAWATLLGGIGVTGSNRDSAELRHWKEPGNDLPPVVKAATFETKTKVARSIRVLHKGQSEWAKGKHVCRF
jgi:NAD(P)-dependent dehydrogenase (short-subunit alcohol dehydrogenase family)